MGRVVGFGIGSFWVVQFWVIGVDAGMDGDWGIWEWGIQQVPGFAVFLEAHAVGLAVGVEAEHRLRGADFYRDYVPDVQGDYVGGYEVDVAFGVDGAAFADGVSGAGFVGASAEGVAQKTFPPPACVTSNLAPTITVARSWSRP